MTRGADEDVYGTTYRDMALTPRAVSWQLLRAVRSAPPRHAAEGDRQATLNAALEQSEELFAAAAGVGSATRPLLLFYGLSQAGRAIAAASPSPNWRLSGHGIKAHKLDAADRGQLSSVTVRDQGRGSFTSLATVLRVGSLPSETSLGDLWPLLPETHRFPLPRRPELQPLYVERESASLVRGSDARVRVYPLPLRLFEGYGDSGEEADRRLRRSVMEYIGNFPTLADASFITPPGTPVSQQYVSRDAAMLPLRIPMRGSETEDELLGTRTVAYGGGRMAFPALGGGPLPQHPVLVWWAVLFALSTLARYEPTAWRRITSIDISEDAAPVEHLLNVALDVLPELIHRTLRAASRGGYAFDGRSPERSPIG